MSDRKYLIKQLQKNCRSLEPDQLERDRLLNQVQKRTNNFLEKLDKGPAYVENHDIIKILEETFSEEPFDESRVFSLIERAVDVPGINPASGNHLGYIPGGGIFTAALGDYWADITNRYAGVFFADPGAVKIENELIRWLIQMVNFPESAWGNLSSGGSIANLTAIVTARDAKGITPEKIENAVIYVTTQTHHCIEKAIRIAGLGNCVVRSITLDPQLHMSVKDLENTVESDLNAGLLPFMVVSSAGTTDSGVIDPILDIAEVCKMHGIWHHVDGAYGAFFLLADSLKEKLSGLELADSIVLDPHKSLFLPYGLGIVLVRETAYLRSSFSYNANYMQDAVEVEEEISPADVSLELTKHFRGLRLWIPLKLHGLGAFRSALEEKHQLAMYFYEEISKMAGFETFQEPELSVVMFRFVDHPNKNEFNKQLIQQIHKDGRVFLSSTTVNGDFWLRVAILVFRTHISNVQLTLSIIKELS